MALTEVLVDTNVLVYAYDRRDDAKQTRALDLLDRLVRTGRGKLSTQVLGEFFRIVTGKLRPALTVTQARQALFAFVEIWPIVSISPMVVLRAVQGVEEHRLAYWDAQLWATARHHDLRFVLSEDFQDGRTLDGVTFLNPFAPAFDLTLLD